MTGLMVLAAAESDAARLAWGWLVLLMALGIGSVPTLLYAVFAFRRDEVNRRPFSKTPFLVMELILLAAYVWGFWHMVTS